MSFGGYLIHTCTLQRAGESRDAYGNVSRVYSAIATNVPCRFVQRTQRAVNTEKADSLVVQADQVFFDADVDVRPRDRIAFLTLEDGTAYPYTLEVTGVTARRGKALKHIAVTVEVIR